MKENYENFMRKMYRMKMKLIMNTRRMTIASPERGGGCAEGADGGTPLVTIADTDQQKMLVFDNYGT